MISDFDGVLVDSTAAIRRAWAAWGVRLGLDGAAIQAANHGRPAARWSPSTCRPSGRGGGGGARAAEVADTDGVVA